MTATFHATRQRMPWLRLTVLAWLFALSAGFVIVLQAVFGLKEQPAPSPHVGQIATLTARLDQTEQQLAALKRQPAPLAPEALAATRETLEARLAQLEVSVATLAGDQQLHALKARIEKLEAAPVPKVAAPPVQRPKVQAKASKPSTLPFQVLGMELRGGDHFISVAPLGSTTAGQMRLLRAGDRVDGWTLEQIESKRAVFRVNGQTQQVVVP